jgi:hypothetical protein
MLYCSSLQAGTAELNAAHSTIMHELKWEDASGCTSYDDFWEWYEGVILGLGQPALSDIQDVCGGTSVAYSNSADNEIKNDPTAGCIDKMGVFTADSGKAEALRDFYVIKKTGFMVEKSTLASDVVGGGTYSNTVMESWTDVTKDAKLIQVCMPGAVQMFDSSATLNGVTKAVAETADFKTAFEGAIASQYGVTAAQVVVGAGEY